MLQSLASSMPEYDPSETTRRESGQLDTASLETGDANAFSSF